MYPSHPSQPDASGAFPPGSVVSFSGPGYGSPWGYGPDREPGNHADAGPHDPDLRDPEPPAARLDREL